MTTAPTPAEVERLAREMCRIDGGDPDAMIYDGPDADLIENAPQSAAWYVAARDYLLAHAAHRALMLEDMAQADAPFLEDM